MRPASHGRNQSFGANASAFSKQKSARDSLRASKHIAAREPDVRRVAAFLDGGIGKGQRALQIAGAGEGDGFGGEQFGFAREFFQCFVGPEAGFLEFAEFDQHADLAGPRGGVLRIELQHFAEEAESGFKVAVRKCVLRFGEELLLALEWSVRRSFE
jgi:hypothetical protein